MPGVCLAPGVDVDVVVVLHIKADELSQVAAFSFACALGPSTCLCEQVARRPVKKGGARRAA